jgi:hypothetical protein
MTDPTSARPGRGTILGIAAAVAAVLIAAAGYLLVRHDPTADPSAPADRHAEIAAKGRQVMPFDLDRTTHVFTKLDSGGRQTVTADDPHEQTQIRLIREHLRTEAAAFARGDFGDPTTIHGTDMPGVAALSAAGDRLAVSYTEHPAGAELTFTTTDPALITAVHAWFDAQTSDHGPHATVG